MTPAIAEEAAALAPAGTAVRVVANGCDFEEFDGLAYTRGERMRVVHAGSFFGQRTPRPFLRALDSLLRARPELGGRVQAAFLGELRPADREWAAEPRPGRRARARGLQAPCRGAGGHARGRRPAAARAARRRPRALGRLGQGLQYLAAERPILALVPPEGDAATLLRETGSAWIADPDDEGEILAALGLAADAWLAGDLEERRLSPEWRERLDRRTRARELADLLREAAPSAAGERV